MTDLKCCPFCGSHAWLETFEHRDKGEVWYVKCQECQASTWYYKTPETAIANWNRRDNVLARLLSRVMR